MTLDRILFQMLIAAVAYLATFVVALALRKKLKFIRSWIWMGLIGTLIYLVIGNLVHFYPSGWEYFKLTSETTSMAIRNAILTKSENILIAWLILTPFACVCIFAMRFLAYFFVSHGLLKQTSSFPITKGD